MIWWAQPTIQNPGSGIGKEWCGKDDLGDHVGWAVPTTKTSFVADKLQCQNTNGPGSAPHISSRWPHTKERKYYALIIAEKYYAR